MYKFWFVFLIILVSCKSNVDKLDNSSDLNTANNFIRSLFQGNFESANTIMLQDSINFKCLNNKKFNYLQTLNKELKLQYKEASIVIKTITQTDSVSYFEYKDPIKNVQLPPLKVIKKGSEWLVDFSYNCSGNL